MTKRSTTFWFSSLFCFVFGRFHLFFSMCGLEGRGYILFNAKYFPLKISELFLTFIFVVIVVIGLFNSTETFLARYSAFRYKMGSLRAVFYPLFHWVKVADSGWTAQFKISWSVCDVFSGLTTAQVGVHSNLMNSGRLSTWAVCARDRKAASIQHDFTHNAMGFSLVREQLKNRVVSNHQCTDSQ